MEERRQAFSSRSRSAADAPGLLKTTLGALAQPTSKPTVTKTTLRRVTVLALPMKLGTSLRFLYPTGPETYRRFKEALLRLEPGGFIERPMGAFGTAEQARNVLEVAAAARAADLDGLLFGDNHAVAGSYANSFAPVPTVARLMGTWKAVVSVPLMSITGGKSSISPVQRVTQMMPREP